MNAVKRGRDQAYRKTQRQMEERKRREENSVSVRKELGSAKRGRKARPQQPTDLLWIKQIGRMKKPCLQKLCVGNAESPEIAAKMKNWQQQRERRRRERETC